MTQNKVTNPFRINALTFNDDSQVSVSNFTIFIGPNNVGKSRALKDIVKVSQTEKDSRTYYPVIVKQTEVIGPKSWTELSEALPDKPILGDRSYHFTTLASDMKQRETSGGLSWGDPAITDVPKKVTAQLSGDERYNTLRRFMKVAVTHLTTDTRLTLLADSESPKNAQEPTNLLQYLYRSGSPTERSISKIIHKYFGKHIRLDFTDLRNLRMKFGADFNDVPDDPRDALEPMSKRELLGEQGDGVRSFTAIITALEAVKRPIIAIDEPEAFLHPPQAFHMGQLLGTYASKEQQFFVATHSSDILRGILSTVNDVTVIRIDRTANKNSFCQIPPETIRKITADALLSSARVLESLFYASAVVTEADADAKFFSIAFNKLNSELDTHFVAAQNKQTVAKILRLYSTMKVKHVGIVDFDMLRKKDELDQAMTLLDFSDQQKEAVSLVRDKISTESGQLSVQKRIEKFNEVFSKIKADIEEVQEDSTDKILEKKLKFLEKRALQAANVTKPWSELKKLGKDGLSPEVQQEFNDLFQLLLERGLCIYPLGELESSLTEFGLRYTSDKKKWFVDAVKLISGLNTNQDSQFWGTLTEIMNSRLI